MGEIRDRGFRATGDGVTAVKSALADRRNMDGQRWRQKDLAEAAGIDERTYRRFINQESVDEITARSICQALAVCFEDVVELVENVVGEPDKSGQLGPNPFEYGKPVTGDRFFGRGRELKFIRDRLAKGTSVSLVGLRRIGKTSLLKQVIERKADLLENSEKWVLVYLDLATGVGQSPETVIEGLRRGIERQIGRAPWLREGNLDPWTFQDGLEDVRNRGFRIVVMLDEFEAIERKLDLFQDWGNDWRSAASAAGLFTMMTASQQSLSEFYQAHRRTSPFDNIFNPLEVGLWEEQDYCQFLNDGFEGRLDKSQQAWLDKMAGRWPYYVQAAASALWDCNLDIGAAQQVYWTQVEGRFATLWRDLTNMEQSALRRLVWLEKTAEGTRMGDRLVRYGVLRADGSLFSEAFGDWIRENGGAL